MSLTRHDPPRSGLDRPDRPRASTGGTLRPLITRLHFYAGVLVAPFVLVAAISGGLYAVSPQLEQAVYDDQLTTESRGPALPLDQQVDAARSVEPDLPLLAVQPATEEGRTTRVLLDDGRTDESRRLAVFVDPVDGDVHGELTAYGSSGSLPVRIWIDELHRSLLLGDVGRVYSELAASWLWVIALAGLALWWTGPSRRTRAQRLRPRRDGSARQRTLSWHGALGTWVVLGMLMLSATGLTWSQFAGANVSDVRSALSWSTPAVVSDLAGDGGSGGHAGHEGHGTGGADAADDVAVGDSPGVGYQAAYEAGRGSDLQGAVEVAGPTSSTGTYVVQELGSRWPTQADAVAIDPADGEVVDVVRFDDYPLAAKLATWGIDLHMGLLFGIWSQIALLLLAGGLVVMTVLGYRMWWLRRPRRRTGAAMGRAPRRGAWRRVPPTSLAALALVTVAIGWFLPVLGVSLLLFVAGDVVAGQVQQRRRARRAAHGLGPVDEQEPQNQPS